LYRSGYELWLVLIRHMRVSGRHVIVGHRIFSRGLVCLIPLRLKCHGAVDLWLAIELQEAKAEQARNDAHEHSADEKRADH
jgi:hypothetical protein